MIHELLSEGEANALTGKELCKLLGITHRDLTLAVQRERQEGQPICASTNGKPGYYLAADRGEMTRYCSSLYKRAGEIHKTRRTLLKTLETLPGQEVQEHGKDEGRN